jgi:tRNA G18 (ribose-2'-O)-methylase SpoU
MRGYFSIGVEGISKGFNLGNLVRTAHAFGASSFFTIKAAVNYAEVKSSDTSHADIHLPFYAYKNLGEMMLPKECKLVGVELLDEAVALPSFRHPMRAAYVLGPEKGSLSPELVRRCDFTVKIPAKFCVNVGVAGALVMYDRMISLGGFAERPVRVGAAASGKR